MMCCSYIAVNVHYTSSSAGAEVYFKEKKNFTGELNVSSLPFEN